MDVIVALEAIRVAGVGAIACCAQANRRRKLALSPVSDIYIFRLKIRRPSGQGGRPLPAPKFQSPPLGAAIRRQFGTSPMAAMGRHFIAIAVAAWNFLLQSFVSRDYLPEFDIRVPVSVRF